MNHIFIANISKLTGLSVSYLNNVIADVKGKHIYHYYDVLSSINNENLLYYLYEKTKHKMFVDRLCANHYFNKLELLIDDNEYYIYEYTFKHDDTVIFNWLINNNKVSCLWTTFKFSAINILTKFNSYLRVYDEVYNLDLLNGETSAKIVSIAFPDINNELWSYHITWIIKDNRYDLLEKYIDNNKELITTTIIQSGNYEALLWLTNFGINYTSQIDVCVKSVNFLELCEQLNLNIRVIDIISDDIDNITDWLLKHNYLFNNKFEQCSPMMWDYITCKTGNIHVPDNISYPCYMIDAYYDAAIAYVEKYNIPINWEEHYCAPNPYSNKDARRYFTYNNLNSYRYKSYHKFISCKLNYNL